MATINAQDALNNNVALPVSLLSTNKVVVKTRLALNNVDNTTDANKPLSTAQTALLNTQVDITSASKPWLNEYAYAAPSVDINFAENPTFTRDRTTANIFNIAAVTGPSILYYTSSSSTYIDSDGLLKYSPENLLKYSEAFSQTGIGNWNTYSFLPVSSINVNGGTRIYSVAPNVSIADANGTSVPATAVLAASGVVASIKLTTVGETTLVYNGGAFTITFSGGTIGTAGTAPAATVRIVPIISNSNIINPEGNYVCNRLTQPFVATDAYSSVALKQTVTYLPRTTYTFSAYVKYDNARYFSLLCNDGSIHEQTFDLQTGAKGAYYNNIVSSSITSVNNGWYRCSITFATLASPSVHTCEMRFSGGDNTSTVSYAGTARGIGNYIYGAQLERSVNLGQYIPTSTAPAYGPRFIKNQGLFLECEGTHNDQANLLTYSNDFSYWGVNGYNLVGHDSFQDGVIGPDALMSADDLREDYTYSSHYIKRTVTNVLTANTLYTFSFFIKKNGHRYIYSRLNGQYVFDNEGVIFDLDNAIAVTNSATGNLSTDYPPVVTACANGWYRCSYTVNTSVNAGSATSFTYYIGTADSVVTVPSTAPVGTKSGSYTPPAYTGNGVYGLYLYGAQFEKNWHVSSYIPTQSSPLTRPMNWCSYENIYSYDQIYNFFNINEGAVFLKFKPVSPSNFTQGVLTIHKDNIMNSNLAFGWRNGMQLNAVVNQNSNMLTGWNDAHYGADLSLSNSKLLNDYNRIALTYSAGNINAAFNGTVRTAVTSASYQTSMLGSKSTLTSTNTRLTFQAAPNRIRLGANGGYDGVGYQPSNIIVSRFTVFTKKLSDQYLKIITQ
jgi:hypothetical protein